MSHWKEHWSKTQEGSRTTTAPRHNDPPTRTVSSSTAPRKHLTTTEAADYLRLSPRSLERYRVEGTGPRFLKAGPGKRARVFYRIADLDAWLEGTLFTSTSEYGDR